MYAFNVHTHTSKEKTFVRARLSTILQFTKPTKTSWVSWTSGKPFLPSLRRPSPVPVLPVDDVLAVVGARVREEGEGGEEGAAAAAAGHGHRVHVQQAEAAGDVAEDHDLAMGQLAQLQGTEHFVG